MSRIILITGNFPIYEKGYKTEKTEFVVSHGVDEDTERHIIISQDHPKNLGAKFDAQIGEWVLD